MIIGIFLVLAGLAVGSFLNVCIDRLPARRSLLRPRSCCPACNRPLAARDLVPVVSYVLLRGRCRYCSAPIPLRVPLVEAGTALIFLLLWWPLGLPAQTALFALIACTLIVIAGIAWESRPLIGRSRRTYNGNRPRE
jgi:leader peptidase (prepilin peptidase)/N-methyltransferase